MRKYYISPRISGTILLKALSLSAVYGGKWMIQKVSAEQKMRPEGCLPGSSFLSSLRPAGSLHNETEIQNETY